MAERPDPTDSTRDSYDRVADEYARRIFDELDHKPFDREILDGFADAVRGLGPVCDLGCGPGQVARYLRARGVDAFAPFPPRRPESLRFVT